MKQFLRKHPFISTFLILICCGVLGIILTAVLFFGNPDPTRATATVQFSFDGAADGIAPNGEKFDIIEAASDEVLGTALHNCGLSDRYSPDQVRPNLVIKGVYPENMAAQVMNYESLLSFTANRDLTVGNYHPTTFNISLYNTFDKKISEKELSALLDEIIRSYQKYFADTYGYYLNDSVLHLNIDDYDYPQRLDILEIQLGTLEKYAGELQEKEPAFRHNGMGFGDIKVRFDNLISSDLARMSADLNMNGLTRDTERMLIQYQYEVKELLNQVEKKQAQLANVDKLISSYEKNEIIYLSTSDSLTKIDGNSSETYDLLVDQRKVLADNITDLKSQADTYRLKMADLLKEDSPELLTATSEKPEDETSIPSEVTDSEESVITNEEKEAVTPEDGTEAAGGDAAEDTDEEKNESGKEEPAAESLTEDNKESSADQETSMQSGSAVKTEETETENSVEISIMSEEELAKAAAEAEEKTHRRVGILEGNISSLQVKQATVVSDFKNLLQAYNDQEINDLTVSARNFRYIAPSVLSGAFIKKAIKVAGPVCALGFMVCMVLLFLHMNNKDKEENRQAL